MAGLFSYPAREKGIVRIRRFEITLDKSECKGDDMAMTVPEIRKKLREADEKELAALERSLAADTRKGVVAALEVARRRIDAEKAERKRIESLYAYERGLLAEGQSIIVGLDEVGRGPVAGPLAVGAVVLPETPHIAGLNDSKQLTPEQRESVSVEITDVALGWAIEMVEPEFIDANGMTAALLKGFSGALAQIEDAGLHADLVLVDGNPLHVDPREKNVVKGDAKCASIAAASIIAKVARDALMCDYGRLYPGYGFEGNKGYGSAQHIEAIKELGLSPVHRRSFCRSFMQESLF